MSTDQLPITLRMVLASEHPNVELAVEQAESFFKDHVIDEDLLYNLVLLTSEAVTNGMEHGNDFDPSKSVTVELKVSPASLEIVVEDEGPGFERRRVPNPLSEDHLFDDGGRGLFLLESIADEVNYELGGRLLRGLLRAEAVAFFTDYSNLLGSDLAASGGGGTTDQFNGGDVHVHGLELSAAYDLGVLSRRGFSVPLHLSYTFTSAQFQSSFESDFEPWGRVAVGDNLPYVPRHQFSGSMGLETLRFTADVSVQYSGRMRTNAGTGDFLASQATDEYLTIDIAAGYRISRRAQIVARVLNLTDTDYIAARRPAGVRPGLPRRVAIGIKTTL